MQKHDEDSPFSVLQILLAPFGSDEPAGRDPRSDTSPLSSYFRLRDARADARAAERSADHEGRNSITDEHWRSVEEHACRILAEIGKDLEVAAWLTEASVRLYGVRGLQFGASLMTGLVTTFWSNGLFPACEAGSEDPRTIALAGLNGVSGDGTLLQSLRMTVLFHRRDHTPATLWHFEQAEELEGLGQAVRKQRRLAAGVLPLQELESNAHLVGQDELRAAGAAAQAAILAWQELGAMMTKLLGQEAPPSSRVVAVLEKIVRIAARLAPPAADPAPLPKEFTEETLITPADADSSGPSAPPGHMPAPPVSREAMLRNLLTVADYFRTHEPHSPLSYALEEAVRRARLSFIELLEEVVPDPAYRVAILSQLGIRSSLE